MPRRNTILAALLTFVVAAAAMVLATRPDSGQLPSLQSLLDHAATADLPFDPQLAAVSCPYERGPVKEGSDSTRFTVSTTVVSTTINYLRGRTKPTHYPRTTRVGGAELHTYQVHAYLTQYKIESDGDIHLVLNDAAGRSMIAEIPYGSCVPTASRWRNAITTARSRFTHALHATTSWHYLHKAVTLRGIGYFDPPHGQTGAARNGLELHPVIGVSFTSVSPGGTAAAAPTATSTTSPTPTAAPTATATDTPSASPTATTTDTPSATPTPTMEPAALQAIPLITTSVAPGRSSTTLRRTCAATSTASPASGTATATWSSATTARTGNPAAYRGPAAATLAVNRPVYSGSGPH